MMELTKQRAVNLHRILWDWLARGDGHRQKSDWPGWKNNCGKHDPVFNDCFLCQWAADQWYRLQQIGQEPIDFCACCPLEWPGRSCYCNNHDGLFARWNNPYQRGFDRRSLARQIRDLPEKSERTDGEPAVETLHPLCIYHKSDLDGKCAAAIIKLHDPDCDLYGMQYGDPIPWDLIRRDRILYMVDFSLPEVDMRVLASLYKGDYNSNFIWVDHHKTAVEMEERCELHVRGIRTVGKAACELTWYLFNPGAELPQAIYLLGRYDVWDHEDGRVMPFQYGMRSYATDPNTPEGMKTWKDLLVSGIQSAYVNNILHEGDTILSYVRQQNAQACEQCAYEIIFNDWRALAMNIQMGSSQSFESAYDPVRHAFMMPYYFNGTKWVVSLFTTHDDIDVSEIAKEHGGGGHAKAAGFTCDQLPEEILRQHIR